LLPANRYIPEGSMQKLIELAKAGATILFYKNLPVDVPGLGNLEQRNVQMKKLLSGIKVVDEVRVNKARIGNGAFFISDNIQDLLESAAVRKEDFGLSGLQFSRRKNEEGTFYFINNRSDKP